MKNFYGNDISKRADFSQQLREAGEELYGDMVKAVIDIEKEVMAVGAELLVQ